MPNLSSTFVYTGGEKMFGPDLPDDPDPYPP